MADQLQEIAPLPIDTTIAPKRDQGAPKRHALTYLRRTAKRVGLQTWDKILEKAVQEALAGDRYARQWLTDLVLQIPPKDRVFAGEKAGPIRAARELVDRIVTERVVKP